MDGSAYRRLDRIDAVVVDADALCTGPPVVIEATPRPTAGTPPRSGRRPPGCSGASAPDGAPRTTARGCGWARPRESPDAPGGEVRTPARGPPPGRHGHRRRRARPARRGAAHRRHRGRPPAGAHRARRAPREIAGAADEVAPAGRAAASTPCAGCRPTGAACSSSPPPTAPRCWPPTSRSPRSATGRAPAWGADLVTRPGLADACRLVAATVVARAVSRRSVQHRADRQRARRPARRGRQRRGTASARRRRPARRRPSSTMLDGAWTAVRLARPPGTRRRRCTRPGTRWTPTTCCGGSPTCPRAGAPADRLLAPVRRGRARCRSSAVPARFARTVAAELADPLTPDPRHRRRGDRDARRVDRRRPRRQRDRRQRADQRRPAAARRDGAGVAAARAGRHRPPRDRRRPRGRARQRAAGRRRRARRGRRRAWPPTPGCWRRPTSRSTSPT